jgi:hypothetical protein
VNSGRGESAAVGWNDFAALTGLRHRMGRALVLFDDDAQTQPFKGGMGVAA